MNNRYKLLAIMCAIACALCEINGAFSQPPQRPVRGASGGGPGAGGGPGRRVAREIAYDGASTLKGEEKKNGEFSTEKASQSAVLASEGVSKLVNPSIVKNGEPSGRSDDYDFYGVNAAVLAYNGATLEIQGGTVESDAAYGNALFAYGEGKIIARDVKVVTKQHNSGGIMATGGGTITADNLSVETFGGSSAPIRSDRGGGVITVNGGKYLARGAGSPTIYSTADITVNDAELVSTAAEGVVIEGKNSIALNRTKLVDDNVVLHGKSTTYKNIFIYQSFSGDAAVGMSHFSAKDCEITTKKGDTIFATNTSCAIRLQGNTIVNEDDEGYFLRAMRGGWGRGGANGGHVELALEGQKVEGDIYLDNISTLAATFAKGTKFVGAINRENTAKSVDLTIDAESTWELTEDSYVTTLKNADPSGDNIILNGHKLYVGVEERAEDGILDAARTNEDISPPTDGSDEAIPDGFQRMRSDGEFDGDNRAIRPRDGLRRERRRPLSFEE